MDDVHDCVEHVFQFTEAELSLTGTVMIEECIRCGAIEVELSGYDEDRSYSDQAPPR